MTLKGNAKFKGEFTRGLKKAVSNLVKFHASSRKSENLDFDELLLSKACRVLAEKVQKSYVLTLKSDAKFEEKLTLGSKNDMRNLAKFNASSTKSENLYCDGLLLSIVCKVSAQKVQKSYLS